MLKTVCSIDDETVYASAKLYELRIRNGFLTLLLNTEVCSTCDHEPVAVRISDKVLSIPVSSDWEELKIQ